MNDICDNKNVPAIPGQYLPPAGLPRQTDQSDSDTCVRFSLAKAIANHLYLREHIDVDELELTGVLVQMSQNVCGMRASMLDKIGSIGCLHGKPILVQDTGNLRKGCEYGSWWEVSNLC